MSIDSISLQIEQLAVKNGGSFKDAFEEFRIVNEILDVEDLYESINDILKEKIKQEFIKKNYIPSLKQNDLLEFTV